MPLSSCTAASTPGAARKRRECFPSSIKVREGEADGVTERGAVVMMSGSLTEICRHCVP